MTSALGVVECHRALRRALPEAEVAEAADNALGDLVVIAITADVVRRASEMGDAIHLATAEAAGAPPRAGLASPWSRPGRRPPDPPPNADS